MTVPHHSRWHDTRVMLSDLLAWLDATQQWVETTVSDPDAQRSRDGLNPDLGSAAPAGTPRSELEIESEAETTARPDLFALLAEMTALRQEVKIQTRSARSDREQAAQTLDQLSSVVGDMSQRNQADDAPPDHVAVDALIELHDAFSRAERQGRLLLTETVNTLREWGYQSSVQDTPAPQPRRWFKRWRWHRDAIPSLAPARVRPPDSEAAQRATAWGQIGREAEQMAARLEGLSTGYALGLRRLERLLAECGIEPMDCVGKPVDAELMEVVQLVTESDQPGGVVVDEVRRGYRRGGQVYRFAQVVAARMPSPQAGAPLSEEGDSQQEVD